MSTERLLVVYIEPEMAVISEQPDDRNLVAHVEITDD
jgi:hypothetical protein